MIIILKIIGQQTNEEIKNTLSFYYTKTTYIEEMTVKYPQGGFWR